MILTIALIQLQKGKRLYPIVIPVLYLRSHSQQPALSWTDALAACLLFDCTDVLKSFKMWNSQIHFLTYPCIHHISFLALPILICLLQTWQMPDGDSFLSYTKIFAECHIGERPCCVMEGHNLYTVLNRKRTCPLGEDSFLLHT